ncbi:hypothetical protein ECSE_P3-0067 (plasmid) [Escherichia coli SE11]|uniref:Uncharacterized protein n=1 Tax=Escherichia coli (strain SE11) TaxID=409438 RepID=A0A979GK49_ECOSE|nr:hypothetical protein ECSE_P3-0067 [Escherichia coli SE11]
MALKVPLIGYSDNKNLFFVLLLLTFSVSVKKKKRYFLKCILH